ncbi:hypothetical protein [uncultured Maribacter sp.]|uniref:hypothetical protein n=1 Tax=uncultured Maribacter sp. TaxID=431308 RepID=UPI0026361074|nr:hypothetical protein [uncultured Maribacter sp.]
MKYRYMTLVGVLVILIFVLLNFDNLLEIIKPKKDVFVKNEYNTSLPLSLKIYEDEFIELEQKSKSIIKNGDFFNPKHTVISLDSLKYFLIKISPHNYEKYNFYLIKNQKDFHTVTPINPIFSIVD